MEKKGTPCIIIAGPPGSGKGTQSKFIQKQTGYVHISTGEIIRNSGNKKLMDAAAEGTFISDEDAIEIVDQFIKKNKNAKGFIWDGYPRSISQIEGFNKVLRDNNLIIDRVICLRANKDVLISRLLERAKLENRADDEIEKIKKRFNTYYNETEPCINALSASYPRIFYYINSDQEIEKINYIIHRILDEIILQ